MNCAAQDVLLIGCGLSNMLIGLRLRQLHPGLRILAIDRGPRLAKEKTWSFHEADCAGLDWVLNLASRRWSSYDVTFDRFSRTVRLRYATLRPKDLTERFESEIDVLWGHEVADLRDFGVKLDNRETVEAACVIDGRGWCRPETRTGYQKFFGLHVELEAPHGLERPVLMDASVPQLDGYRFFYLLPWTPHSLLIEDTRYSSSPQLEPLVMQNEIASYARSRGWKIRHITATESESLPIPLSPLAKQTGPVPKVGVAGGFFHPVTGYSLLHAARIAERVAHLPRVTSAAVLDLLLSYQSSLASSHRYLIMLNRLLFDAARPEERFRIFSRFYGFSEDLIERFYGDRLAWPDKARLLLGRPPVPIWPALRTIVRPHVHV